MCRAEVEVRSKEWMGMVGLLVFEFLGLEKRQVGRPVNFVRASTSTMKIPGPAFAILNYRSH